jgi:hypothetical protein
LVPCVSCHPVRSDRGCGVAPAGVGGHLLAEIETVRALLISGGRSVYEDRSAGRPLAGYIKKLRSYNAGVTVETVRAVSGRSGAVSVGAQADAEHATSAPTPCVAIADQVVGVVVLCAL